MSDPAQAEVLYEVSGGIATLTLNRPERLNAITRPMLARTAAMRAPSASIAAAAPPGVSVEDRAFWENCVRSAGINRVIPRFDVRKLIWALSSTG